jgi:hypothetical protein
MTAKLVSTSVLSRKIESNASENNQEIGKKVAKFLTILGLPRQAALKITHPT